ncbi:MAG: hypothetical protein JSV04_10340 [Candidatus Heimdallarchaeota archaeon]|nr:MAG: hypothetical protein JSV04_10340 [Candidatus Heimdallarchaeota archaeon]
MFTQKIKEIESNKTEKQRDEIQALRTLGIVWFCLGATNSMFFILGLVFLITSIVKQREFKEGVRTGGLA